ncbi:MAG: urease accessory protein UreD, partial [Reyranella sp.]|nr:urease accessory protein UreD [Reyranella sp.]
MTTSPSVRMQRASGESRVTFDVRDGKTRLGDLYQRDPCRVLFPKPEVGEPPQAVMITTSGGVTGGDALKMSVEIGPGAEAVATTQAAEKIYRASRGSNPCTIDVEVRVAE